MLTRCPNPACRLTFDVPGERAGKNGPCPQCGQVITFRSLEILNKLERQRAALEAQGSRSTGASPPPFGALLEDVRSLWNVGSIFRTADGAGVGALYLCGITGCPPRKEIAKTSLGSEEVVPWEYHAGALDVVPRLKAAGVYLVGLELTEASRPLDARLSEAPLPAPLCLAVGNEVAGLSAELLNVCDEVCHLPMRGVKHSLNVAVAFGIAAYRIAETLPPRRPTSCPCP